MEGKRMMIQYVLTKAEWDDYHEANHILAKIKAILATSGIYNHELSIPAMTMYLVAKNDELNTAHKTLKEVTEQRDGLRSGIDCASDQLAAVTEQLKEAHEEIVKLTQGWADCVLKRSKAEEQRDRLTEALEQWQPIETAPKDRSFILSAHPEHGYLITRWLGAREMWDGWAIEPTHWMSLPKQPNHERHTDTKD